MEYEVWLPFRCLHFFKTEMPLKAVKLLNRLLRRSVSASPSTMWQRRLWPNWHGVTAEDHTSVCDMYLKYMISL